MQWLLSVVFRAVVFKLLFWCGAEGYVSGLQDAALQRHPQQRTQKTTQNWLPLPSPHHTYERSLTYLDTNVKISYKCSNTLAQPF